MHTYTGAFFFPPPRLRVQKIEGLPVLPFFVAGIEEQIEFCLNLKDKSVFSDKETLTHVGNYKGCKVTVNVYSECICEVPFYMFCFFVLAQFWTI